MGLLAPSPRKFFEKNLTKNFPLWCGANIMRSIVERRNYGKKQTPVSKFLKDRGVGKGKLLPRSFLSPRKNIKFTIPFQKFFERGAGKSFLLRKFSPQKSISTYLKNPLTISSSASFSVRPRVISLISCSPAILPIAAS